MKKLSLFLFVILGLSVFSCSSSTGKREIQKAQDTYNEITDYIANSGQLKSGDKLTGISMPPFDAENAEMVNHFLTLDVVAYKKVIDGKAAEMDEMDKRNARHGEYEARSATMS